MRRNEVLALLRAEADAIRGYGVTALYLYGSAARDELNAGSDIDLFADVDYGRFGFVPFMDVRDFLKSILGRKVDFTTRSALHPDLKAQIVRSAVRVFDNATVDTVAAEVATIHFPALRAVVIEMRSQLLMKINFFLYRATSFSHSSSLSTLTPSSWALPSFEPAPGPATT